MSDYIEVFEWIVGDERWSEWLESKWVNVNVGSICDCTQVLQYQFITGHRDDNDEDIS